ncbi:serine/threonine protein kinase [Bacillus sp. SRB1LM]|uniref:serine/threonine protein kinase n=1 Tax=Bacillus sp. SRB1LM TaxID=2608688 RepID=UPI0018C4394D|nr:serine/threonine protein kinase [Bacillus sp. SRB1LM]MBG0962446.1 serine/threonine protein kinase [Bacillus sp. SRB1LM]
MDTYTEQFKKEKYEDLNLWKEMVLKIFGGDTKESIKINDRHQIIEVLNAIGIDKASNYMVLPSGGGLELASAVSSKESGLIELQFDGKSTQIVNPVELNFHPVGDNPEWWYFRLITKPFNKSGVYAETPLKEEIFLSETQKQVALSMKWEGEEVLEIRDREYVKRSVWDRGYLGLDEQGYEIPIPDEARIVRRQCPGGDYIIFNKYSAFNQVSSTDDGGHNQLTDEAFRSLIGSIVEKLAEKK